MHGRWGFDPFEGPDYVVQRPDGGTGARRRRHRGAGCRARQRSDPGRPRAGCVDDVSLRLGNSATSRSVTFRAVDATHLAVTVPLAEGETGELRLDVHQQSLGTPASVSARAGGKQPDRFGRYPCR
jgi:hypothetical protein